MGKDNWPIFVKGYHSHDMASDSSCGNAALFISAVFAVTCLMCERSCEPILEKLTAVNG